MVTWYLSDCFGVSVTQELSTNLHNFSDYSRLWLTVLEY